MMRRIWEVTLFDNPFVATYDPDRPNLVASYFRDAWFQATAQLGLEERSSGYNGSIEVLVRLLPPHDGRLTRCS